MVGREGGVIGEGEWGVGGRLHPLLSEVCVSGRRMRGGVGPGEEGGEKKGVFVVVPVRLPLSSLKASWLMSLSRNDALPKYLEGEREGAVDACFVTRVLSLLSV